MASKKITSTPHEYDQYRDYIIKRTLECVTRPVIAQELGLEMNRFKNYCETRGYKSAKDVMAEYDEFFKSHYGAMSLQVMAPKKGVSVEFVKKRLVKMKLMKKERANLGNPVVCPRIRKYNEILGSAWV